ncbi:hypothetical protein EDB81DRAFT_934162 [Dactylonectria macrodidyma]|uniref:Prion-inhibition and propagation HeLo domain-containing protein n=1 Tax=Dactylonectria macrodidyma TaxID=307937 RepID=A0A9P9EW59_9HYPO|nr:hypothetical protein EDB81DRAFT_934162 [Dactylonectria macrodidyma]
MELLGLAASVAGLGLTAIQLLPVVSNYQHIPRDVEVLFLRSEVQKAKLRTWLKKSGLSDVGSTPNRTQDLPPPLNETYTLQLAFELLASICLLSNEFHRKGDKYRTFNEWKAKSLVAIVKGHPQLAIEDLDRKTRDSFIGKSKEWLESVPRKVKWSTKMKADLVEVSGLIDTILGDLCGPSFTPNPPVVEGAFLLQALNQVHSHGLLRQALIASNDLVQGDSGVNQVAALSYLRNQQTDAPMGSVGVEGLGRPALIKPAQLRLDIKSFPKLPSDNRLWYPDKYTNGLVDAARMVEWRPYDLTDDEVDDPSEGIRDSIVGLAMDLHATQRVLGFLTLDCIGYIHDKYADPQPRFGLVYRLPTSESTTVTLFDRIKLQIRQPTLGARIKLLKDLSVTMHRLLLSGWLHKNISSHSIILTGVREQGLESELGPRLIGFHTARLDHAGSVWQSKTPPENAEEDRYRHPSKTAMRESMVKDPSQRVPYQKFHDIYSFGIVCLEIGLWATMQDVYKDTFKTKKGSKNTLKTKEEDSMDASQLATFQKEISGWYTEKLGYKIGSIVQGVVQACLSGRLVANSENVSDDDIIESFNELVVGQLAKCHI